MLFNKHSETKQRFGIRKLTIGACSVLLSTLFLTVNNGQQVNAATDNTVTNADNNKTETDNESVTKENEATKTNNDSSVSLNKDATEVTNTSNGTDSIEKQKPEVEDKNGSAKVDDTKATEATEATEDKSSDNSSDQKLTEDKTANNKLAKATVNKLAVTKLAKATVNKLAVTTDDSTPVLSQSAENGNMGLSISLPELSNKDYIPQTIKLNATNVNSGDKIVIKVKKSSAYGFAKENFPIGTVKESDQGDYRIFELDINTTGKFEYKITAKRTNNYQGQASPMQDTGVTTKDIQWSINGEDQAPLSFKQTIIPELISNGVSLAKATGDKNTDFTEVAPNEDYNFVYYMGENDGLVHDGSYMAGIVNSAVNYGTTITIPVPENFLLNQEVSDKANKERGLTDFTMTQDGMGKDVIITVPKGQSAQGWNSGGRYYTLTGKFVYDQIPEEPTTVTAKGDSVIDQIYTSDGQRITAKGKPFSVTISGKKGRPASGPLSLSVSGAISNNQLLLDSNPNNDPVAVNWFGYSNDYDNIENAKIKLDLADGLYVTGIKTPKDLGTVYNNIGNIQSYTYEMTLTNGQKITGTVKAGDIAKSTATTTDADNNQTIIGIRSIVFTPDTNTIGKDTKTDNLPNPGRIVDQEDRIDGKNPSNVFIALGHLSHTYDNGSQVKANDKLTSSITIFGSNFRPHRYNNNPIVSYTSSNIQTVFDTSQYKASLSTYGGQNSTNPGNQNAGGISLGDGDGRSNYDYIFEPIFYYVIPDNAVYSGGAISRLNSNGNESPVPVVTTYFVNGHQVVKLDYSNTNYYYNTKYGTNNGIPLDNVNNQTSNTRSWEIYAYSKDIPLLNNSYTSGKFLTPETAEKSGSTLKLDPSKFYYIGGGTWTINTASAVVLADAANGNKNPNGLYVQNGTSDDKGSDGMNFRVNVVNYDMTTDLKDLTAFINLPVKGYNNTTTNFFLSGPVDVPDGTVLYSTSSTDLPSGVGTKTPSTDNFLTKEQVEAKIASREMSWSDVKSIAVKYDTVKANSATKDIYIHGTDPDITTDAGKVAQISWGLYGGNGMPPLVKKNASTIDISGSSTVKTRLHYVDPKGKDQYVDVPTMSKTYKDNSDTMRDSDFNEKNIPASLIPKGYELVLQKNENGKAVAVKSIIDNGGKTWATHAEDGSAQFGKLVLYNFDGDTVQFELKAQQELQVKVYDDDADDPSQALDTTKTGATVDFIGNSGTAFPTDLKTNLETLKKYYEDKNYIVTLPVATGNFDNTPNRSGSDEQIQVLEVHLTHAKDVKTEYAKAVRNITYEGAGKQTPATKSDTFDNAFSRTITTDKVTGKVTISDWTGSHTFDSVNSPSVEGYHPDKASAGNIEATANSLNVADESTLAELLKTGVVVSDHVTYSPDKQEVKIRVYDDTTGRELSPETDIKEQGKDVEINLSGTSNEIIPTEFGNNIDLLKEYYQSKGYKFISNTSVPQYFDQTSNGSSETDSNPQYINIHLEHDLSLEKETKTVTRTINYYDQDKNQLINDADNKVTEPQTVVQEVDFARYAVRDKVTNQIIGYATPDQVTVNGDDAQLTKKNGYTPVTGKASDAVASYVVTSTDSKFASQTNYDLSKYGYEAPTTKKGDSFAQIDELTPLPTDTNSIVNVYYREKVVTVTVDNPPTIGKKVPGTDAEFPPNEWSEANATSTSTRTIHYVYDDNTFANGDDVSGQAVPGLKDIIQKVKFAQSAKINLVTGDVSYQGDWNAISSTTTNQQGEEVANQENGNYAEVISPSSKTGYPELKGYTAHQEVVNASQATHGVDVGQVLVKYTANYSLVQIEYVDQDTGLALKVDTKNGKSGEKIHYSTTDTIADYEKSGYELVHDGFTANDGNHNKETFDSYDDVPDSQRPETINQKWKVTLKHKKITVTNDDPKDPDDKGYDHNYPTGVSETDLNNTVRRNISFIYTDKPEGSNQAFPTETQEVAYKRQATIDLVKLANGDSDAVSYSNWELKEAGKESFDSYQVKPIKGYVANYELVPSADVYKDQDGKAENGQDVVVKYSPVGKIIPIDKDGNKIPNAPTPEYNNDPTDPTDPTKTTTTDVPEIPGYHAEVPNVTPDNPLEDTKVVYVKNTQVIDLVYVDTKTNTTLTTQNDVAHGDSGSTIPTSVTDTLNSTIQSYLDKGYVIDPDKVSGTVPDTFDFSDQAANGADKEHQVVTIYLNHGTVTVTGNDPKTPGEPINPKDPNGSKYPPEAGKDNLVISSQNIIHYYDEAGNKILDDKVNTDDSTLTRTVTIDKVTGKVTNTSDWTGGKEYENVNTPVVNGYYVDKASASAGASTVTPADADPNSGRVHKGVITNETTVIYHPMGHIIPIDKSGNKIPGAERPIFNNDPNDPTKASTTNSPIIPGYHLETPSDSAITPDEPGKNRPVVYVADTQELKVQVFDLDGDTPDEPLKTDKTGATVDFTGDSFTNFPSDVATNVDSLIKYYTDRGYLVKTKPRDEELSGKFDGDKTQTQYLKLQLVHDKVTVSGEDENTPAPDTPINENDPDSVKYPSDVSKDNLVISSEVIIHYEGAGEKTPKDVIRTVDKTLTRTVTIDKVTGKVTNTSDWSSNTTEYESVLTPQIQGYTSDKVQVDKVSITKDNAGEAKNEKITYTFNVVYTPDKQQLILKVHDEDTQSYLGDPVIFDGYSDQEVGNSSVDKLEELKKKYLDLGYEIVEIPQLDKNYDDTQNVGGEPDKEPQVFVLKVKHRIVPVTPDDPKTPDDIIPDSNQNYPGGLTETDLSRTITRTIVVNFPSGTSQEIKQVVTYTGTATVDAVTKEVKYSAWTTKNSDWPEQVAPTVPGYTPDKDKVDLTYVPADGNDVTVEINYTADPETDEPTTPVKPGETITPVTPTKPVKPTKPSKPEKPAKQTKPEVVKPVKETKGKQLYGSAQAKVDSKAARNVVDKNKANGTNDKKLPQTNSESDWQLSLLGVGVLALALLVLKKKRDDE
ncbi:YSIRK-type signal peptide-containing protein [Lactobacillus johnsonii]|uniref:mucin-binding protein n=1 Tax=Lactobacillus johnsonii TaxID=33959 RepID=UPI001303D540|nr:YSIRK-type signal peptide-containing protein [Lactobacillus johnsonii]QGY97441.1 YSIRK-type signal peptide-containing protein [Lactobacillus johnsonii]